MNKTVNINLAGIFFHIDEDAYSKLQRYLEAIKRSFTDSQGRSEIIADIEARIAELFSERVQNEKQVISTKQVDEVITIMGQPEDYLVDDEIFEDEPRKQTSSRPSRKLLRDTENSYVGGVSSGLAHYFGIDVIWVRLAWILLIFGAGTGILLYILLWILLPEALTTSDKLMMKGEPVNISNIEKKIKGGITTVTDTVSETVRNVDFEKHGNSIKSSSQTFFDTLGDVFMFFLKVAAKFIGVILILVGAATLIGLLISLFTVGIVDAVHMPGVDFVELSNSTGAPIWIVSLLMLFAIGIPFFFLAYLGLKILVNNLKSIGNVAKYSLLGLWLMSVITLAILGAKQGLSYKEDAKVVKTDVLSSITKKDTLILRMAHNENFERGFRRDYDFEKDYDENDNRLLVSQGIRLIVRSTNDSVAKIKVEKMARGEDYTKAKKRAEGISYDYQLVNNQLLLNNYFTINKDDKIKSQEMQITVYLPVGSVLYADENTYYYHRNDTNYYNDILNNGDEEHYLQILNGETKCIDCPENEEDDYKIKVDVNDDDSTIKIDDNGLEIKTEGTSLKIDDNGIKAKSVDVKVSIDEDGIQITSDKKDD